MRAWTWFLAAMLCIVAGCSTYRSTYRSPDGRVVVEASGRTSTDGVATVMGATGELSTRVEHPAQRAKELRATPGMYFPGYGSYRRESYEDFHERVWGYRPY